MKVLLIEDNPGDAFLIKFYLEEFNSVDYELTHAQELSEGLQLLSDGDFDIILCDLYLPDSSGIETLIQLLDAHPESLVIVLTGLSDEKIGIETVKAGAQDFLAKGRFDGKVLNSSIRYAFERFQLSKELKKYTFELNTSRNKLDELQELVHLGYFEFNVNEDIVKTSNRFDSILNTETTNKAVSLNEFTSLVKESDNLAGMMKSITSEKKEEEFTLKASGKKVKIYAKSVLDLKEKSLIIGAVQIID